MLGGTGGQKIPDHQNARPKGRPRQTSTKTLRRGEYATIFNNAGLSPEEILRAVAPARIPRRTLPERERQKMMKRTIDRWIEAYLRLASVAEQLSMELEEEGDDQAADAVIGLRPWQWTIDQRLRAERLAHEIAPRPPRDGPVEGTSESSPAGFR